MRLLYQKKKRAVHQKWPGKKKKVKGKSLLCCLGTIGGPRKDIVKTKKKHGQVDWDGGDSEGERVSSRSMKGAK